MYKNYPRKSDRQILDDTIAGYLGCAIYVLGTLTAMLSFLLLFKESCS